MIQLEGLRFWMGDGPPFLCIRGKNRKSYWKIILISKKIRSISCNNTLRGIYLFGSGKGHEGYEKYGYIIRVIEVYILCYRYKYCACPVLVPGTKRQDGINNFSTWKFLKTFKATVPDSKNLGKFHSTNVTVPDNCKVGVKHNYSDIFTLKT